MFRWTVLTSYDAPSFQSPGFNCPFCGYWAHQKWARAQAPQPFSKQVIPDTQFAQCEKCQAYSIWHKEVMIFPTVGSAPPPHPDLPKDIKEDYEEARAVASRSPKSAAALLRLTIDKLMNIILEEEVLEDNKKLDLNDKIKLMVQKGLSPDMQRAFDSVRIIGNKAVHPGQIDLNDNPQMVNKLFELVNIIARQTITEPKATREFYDNNLPEGERNNIEKRNGNKAI